MSIRIMALVWEASAQTGGNLLLLLALADFANDEGECWPAVSTLAKKSRMSDRHVRRILRTLEEAGEIERLEAAGQHGTNRYLIAPKVRADILSVGSSTPDPLTPASVTPDAHVPQSVKNHQQPSDKDEEGKALKEEATKFVDWFLVLLAETGAPPLKITDGVKNGWADAYEKLVRIDGRKKEEIVKVCRWARRDPFWRDNFLSPAKLRQKDKQQVFYYDVFLNKLTHNGTSSHRGGSTRGFEQSSDLATVTDK